MGNKKLINNIVKQVSSDLGMQIDKNDPVVVSALIVHKALAAELTEIKSMVAANSANTDNGYKEANRKMIEKNADSVKNINEALKAWATKADDTFDRLDKRLSIVEADEKEGDSRNKKQLEKFIEYTFYGVIALVLIELLKFLT